MTSTLVRNQLVDMIDLLHESEQALLLEIVKRFMPDDIATKEDLEDIAIAKAEYARGEFLREDDINWK
ncbi:MAG: hypothetical protein FWC89_10980 [Defluviitaleaceae bacterium]|nr:hypothetical protein [Defluviitaleaceae bacterium]